MSAASFYSPETIARADAALAALKPADDFACCSGEWEKAACAGCMLEIERDPHEPNDRRAWRHTGSDGGTTHLATPYEDVIA